MIWPLRRGGDDGLRESMKPIPLAHLDPRPALSPSSRYSRALASSPWAGSRGLSCLQGCKVAWGPGERGPATPQWTQSQCRESQGLPGATEAVSSFLLATSPVHSALPSPCPRPLAKPSPLLVTPFAHHHLTGWNPGCFPQTVHIEQNYDNRDDSQRVPGP